MGCSGSKRTRSLCDNPPSVTCVEPCPSPPPLLRRTSTDAMPDEKSSHRRSVMNGGGDQVGNHEEDNDNTMMDTTISPLLVGRLPAHLFLNGYLVLRHLGEGTTSTVTLAWSYMSSRLVAIKSIPFAASTSLQDHRGTSLATPYRIQHLHANDEVAALESLDHPNICRVYDVIESRDEMCLVLEYLEGGAVQPPAGLDPHLRRLYPNTVAPRYIPAAPRCSRIYTQPQHDTWRRETPQSRLRVYRRRETDRSRVGPPCGSPGRRRRNLRARVSRIHAAPTGSRG